jgi:hypothetical protein
MRLRPSSPCPFGSNFAADAALGDEEIRVDLKSARTPILGHVLELSKGGTFVVRK